MDNNAILTMRHISKNFPGVVALSDVDFTLRSGEIHVVQPKLMKSPRHRIFFAHCPVALSHKDPYIDVFRAYLFAESALVAC